MKHSPAVSSDTTIAATRSQMVLPGLGLASRRTIRESSPAGTRPLSVFRNVCSGSVAMVSETNLTHAQASEQRAQLLAVMSSGCSPPMYLHDGLTSGAA